MTDVLALSHKIAKLLDPIAPEHRAAVLQLLRTRYQLGALTGAERKRRFHDRWGTGTEQLGTVPGNENGTGAEVSVPPTPPSAPLIFKIPESIEQALRKSRVLGSASTLWSPIYWQAEVRANPGVDFAAEILKAEAWMHANPDRAPRKNFGRFLHTWLRRASERVE